jgi:hypothetical protein
VEQADNDGEPSWSQFGFVLLWNQGNLEYGDDLDALRDFTPVSSDYYPDLASHYAQAIEEWYEARLRELPAEE